MIRYRDVKNLKYHAREFALMMDDADIDRVIVEFVEVRNQRQRHRR
jgi:hypothetical protein